MVEVDEDEHDVDVVADDDGTDLDGMLQQQRHDHDYHYHCQVDLALPLHVSPCLAYATMATQLVMLQRSLLYRRAMVDDILMVVMMVMS